MTQKTHEQRKIRFEIKQAEKEAKAERVKQINENAIKGKFTRKVAEAKMRSKYLKKQRRKTK